MYFLLKWEWTNGKTEGVRKCWDEAGLLSNYSNGHSPAKHCWTPLNVVDWLTAHPTMTLLEQIGSYIVMWFHMTCGFTRRKQHPILLWKFKEMCFLSFIGQISFNKEL